MKENRPRLSGEEARPIILAAAAEILAERGMEGLRIRLIADRAGMHHSTLLYHFANRREVVSGLAGVLIEQLKSVVDAGVPPGKEQEHPVLVHVEKILDLMETEGERFALLTEIFAAAQRDAQLRETLRVFEDDWIDFIAAQLSRQQRDSGRGESDSRHVAFAIVAMVKGLGLCLNVSREAVLGAVRRLT